MITLLPDNFVLQSVTQSDQNIASIALGFTLGFGLLTAWTAIKQTKSIWLRHGSDIFRSPYVWMIWLEIIDCLVFSLICWLYLQGVIPPSFAFYFVILTLWALQVQFLLQIIINRVSILLVSRRKSFWLKTSVAVIITAINISVYNIWIPARLQISPKYIAINNVWDRCEKGLYLAIDASLNWYFMRTVKKQLLGLGLSKYQPLLTFNLYIIGFSLAMDVLIISMMSLRNTFVYMQFHPLAYIVKLNIEMSMANLIAKVSKPSPNEENERNFTIMGGFDDDQITNRPTRNSKIYSPEDSPNSKTPMHHHKDFNASSSDTDGKSHDLELMELDRDVEANRRSSDQEGGMIVHTRKEVHVTVSRASVDGEGRGDGDSGKGDSDERPLREILENETVDKHGKRSGNGFGSRTQIWGYQKHTQ